MNANFVKIPGKDFEMAATQVIQEWWQQVMGSNPSRFKLPRNPVESVSWYACQKFIDRLNENDQRYEYRLPTSSEWEYCCHAGGSAKIDDVLEVAWCWENSDGQTYEVGTKKPNAWGLFDMRGNVWEWCQDTENGSSRVARGGSWSNSARYLRSANRIIVAPDNSFGLLGFRLVRTLRPKLLPSNPSLLACDSREQEIRKLLKQVRSRLRKIDKLLGEK